MRVAWSLSDILIKSSAEIDRRSKLEESSLVSSRLSKELPKSAKRTKLTADSEHELL